MRSLAEALLLMTAAALLWSQPPMGPVVNPRGVINPVSCRPAPSVVAPGGILRIEGFSLGPPGGVRADGTPLPAELGDPPIRVFVNGRQAPIFAAYPDRILVQVPWDTEPGLATVIVRRGEASSRPARVLVNRVAPAVHTANGRGFGEIAGTLSGNVLHARATGLGPTEPAVGDGAAGPADPPARPQDPVRAFVGGLPAPVRATLSAERVGEFDLRIELPPGTRPGDVLTIQAGAVAASPVTIGKADAPEIQFLDLADAPRLQSLVSPGLTASYAIASAARGEDGCYPSYLFDFYRGRASRIEACLTAAPNARTPVVASADSPRLAALLGPPAGDVSAGISSKVIVFDATREQPVVAELPEPAVGLTALAGGNFAAVLAGTPPRTLLVDGRTGEVREAPAAGGVAAGLLPAPKADDMPHMLALVALPDRHFAALLADDPDRPTRARLVVVDREGQQQASRDFPEGWVPLLAPQRPQTGQAGQAAQVRRALAYLDGIKQVLYVLSRRADDSHHGMILFSLENPEPLIAPFPDGWFAASCTANLPVFTLELARKIVVPGAAAPEAEIKDPCPATGFVLVDLETRQIQAAALPGQSQFNVGAATGDVNDFIFGVNTDPSRRNIADTLFVLDGVTASVFRMDLPPGVTGFTGLTPVPALNAIVALAMERAAGDAGFVYFDLENAEARLMPTPDGFTQVNLVGIFEATRKLVARGIKSGGAGSQYLVYDLGTGEVVFPSHPEAVAWVGNVVRTAAQTAQQPVQPGQGQVTPGQPVQPGQGQAAPGQPGQGGTAQPAPGQPSQPGQGGTAQPAPGGTPAQPVAAAPVLQQSSPRSNAISAVAYDGQGRQAGVLLLRVP